MLQSLYEMPEQLYEKAPVSRQDCASLLRQLADALSQQLEQTQERETRSEVGQFTTPSEAARSIVDTFDLPGSGSVRILDPGAGSGALTLALLAHWIEHEVVVAAQIAMVETDPTALELLQTAAEACKSNGEALGINIEIEIIDRDFCDPTTWTWLADEYDLVLMNPPYQKLRKNDPRRSAIANKLGVDCPNLYAAFLSVGASMLSKDGSLAAITPRSFANGLYFSDFRRDFLERCDLRKVILFDRRDRIFKSSSVLQETVILRADRSTSSPGLVTIETKADHVSAPLEVHDVPYESVVASADTDRYINLPGSGKVMKVIRTMASKPEDLSSLGLSVSTGQVVDFRLKELLQDLPSDGAVPLIYPQNLKTGSIEWPIEGKKPQGFDQANSLASLTMPNGVYVLIKRFTSKEESRRVVASVYSPIDGYDRVAFENHLNVVHRDRGPITRAEAEQLVQYLNSADVDEYFRSFSGSTQVNATDLRRMRFPTISLTADDEAEIDLRTPQRVLFSASGVAL